jgi:hypothetical protein
MSSTWHVGSTALLGLALSLGAAPATTAPAAAAPAQDRPVEKRGSAVSPGDHRGATVIKTGWWWLVNEPPPETGLLAAPAPASPTTPKGAIPVGAVNGDPEKVSAIEVKLRAETGSQVKALDLVLRESDEPGATTNAESARILACPVTELFWADGSAAAWKDQPAYDCTTAKAEGERTKKGLWHFDLAEIATTWLAEGNTDSRSVVLVEDVDAPESFQVAFDGVKDEGVGLRLVATPGPALPDTGALGEDVTASAGTTGSSGAGLGGTGGGAALGGAGAGLSQGSGAAAPASGETAGEKPQEVAIAPVATNTAWHSGIPRAALLLVPVALLLAYLVMLSLGPAGRPVPVTGRHGVSRALDRLRQTGRGAGSGR